MRGVTPEGKQYKVPHNQANQPEGCEVDVPVPGVAGLRLKAAQEGVIHNGCCSILYKGADVQQIPPAGKHRIHQTLLLRAGLDLNAEICRRNGRGSYSTVLEGWDSLLRSDLTT